jgi:tetratricopeptide (TPR) repeat protein
MLKGEHELARTWFQRALVIARRIAPVSTNVAMVLGNFAECWLAEGRADIAYVYASEALVVWQQSVPDHPEEAHFLLFVADAALALGREDIARDPAERALQLRLRHRGDPGQLAHAQFTVARMEQGTESVALGLAALTNLVASPDVELRARVVEWLTSIDSRVR